MRAMIANIRSAWAKAEPAVSAPGASTTIRSAANETAGNRRANAAASHQVVVARWPSNAPVSANKNVAEQDAASMTPLLAARPRAAAPRWVSFWDSSRSIEVSVAENHPGTTRTSDAPMPRKLNAPSTAMVRFAPDCTGWPSSDTTRWRSSLAACGASTTPLAAKRAAEPTMSIPTPRELSATPSNIRWVIIVAIMDLT